MPKRNAVTISRSFHCFVGDFFDAGRFKCPMIEKLLQFRWNSDLAVSDLHFLGLSERESRDLERLNLGFWIRTVQA